MKTMETTEAVSSDDPEKRVKRLKYQRSTLVVRGKRRVDHNGACKTVEQEENQENTPRCSWARNHMGNPGVYSQTARNRAFQKFPFRRMGATMRGHPVILRERGHCERNWRTGWKAWPRAADGEFPLTDPANSGRYTARPADSAGGKCRQ